MKTFALLAAASLVAGVAVPDHVQIATVTCSDGPKETVTVTAPCNGGSGGNGGYSGGGQGGYNGGAPATVTVTETTTITQGGTYQTGGAGNGGNEGDNGGNGGNSGNGENGGSSNTAVSPPGAAQTHMVQVGAFTDPMNPAKKLFEFRPNNITAKKDDVVKFQMLAAAHSVTQSNFATPCTNNGGFDTDLVNNTGNAQDIFRDFTVKDDAKPLWFYCKQKVPVSHCGAGMVFGINPKSQDQMQQFIDTAKAQQGNSTSTLPPSSSGTSSSISTGTSAPSAAQTYDVQVGAFPDPANPAKKLFQFRPNSVLAKKGDVVNFHMLPAAHSVTQSAFAKPCVKTGPFDTELIPVAAGAEPVLKTYTVEDVSKPLWFYCKQKMPVSHCGTGMVFGINPKSPEQMQQFVDMAIQQNGTVASASAGVSTTLAQATNAPYPTTVGGYVAKMW